MLSGPGVIRFGTFFITFSNSLITDGISFSVGGGGGLRPSGFFFVHYYIHLACQLESGPLILFLLNLPVTLMFYHWLFLLQVL